MDRFYYEDYLGFGNAFFCTAPDAVLNYLSTLNPAKDRHVLHIVDSQDVWVCGGELLEPILKMCEMLSIQSVPINPSGVHTFVQSVKEHKEKHGG